MVNDAAIGAVLTAAPGEALYSESMANYDWNLVFDEAAQIGPYAIEAGAYRLSGVSSRGRFFEIGDGCAGEPAVTAARFADAPQHLFVPANGQRLCVATVFDYMRCGSPVGALRPSLSEFEQVAEFTLVYEGLDEAPVEGELDPDEIENEAAPIARFTLQIDHGPQSRSRALSAPVGAEMTAMDGRFQVLSASETEVTVIFFAPFNQAEPLAPPALDAEYGLRP